MGADRDWGGPARGFYEGTPGPASPEQLQNEPRWVLGLGLPGPLADYRTSNVQMVESFVGTETFRVVYSDLDTWSLMVKLVEVSSELTRPQNPNVLTASNGKALEHLVDFYTPPESLGNEGLGFRLNPMND